MRPRALKPARLAGSAGSGAASGGGAGVEAGAGPGDEGAVAGAAAPEADPIIAIGAPTGTVSPSAARISRMVPATGEGTSVSTLSVEISRRTSSTLMVSPTAFAHDRIVPSVTVSPSCGMETVVCSPPLAGAAAAGAGGAGAGGAGAASGAGAGASAAGALGGAAGLGGAGALGADGCPDSNGSALSTAAGAAGAAPPVDSPASPITARLVPTATVSPSATSISSITPATGEGISVSTLSVEISTRTSSTPIVSPTCLAHDKIVPSVTVSPSWGIATLVAMGPPSAGFGRSMRSTSHRRLRTGLGARG